MASASVAWSRRGLAAGTFPDRPIRLVVPFPPGGTTDISGRVVSQLLGEQLKGTIVVENVSGAAGVLGSGQVARARPDGYTLVLGNISTHAIAAALQPNLPYKPLTDFEPIAHTGKLTNLLVVHPSLRVNSVQELIAYAKANPGKLSYGSSGSGGTPHLSAELFKLRTGTDMVHIPYRGSAPMLSDLLGGQIHLSFGNLPELLPHVADRRLIALGVTSSSRWPSVSDIPTIQEQGVPDFDISSWMGLFAPAGLPPEVRDRLVQAASDMQKSTAFGERLAQNGFMTECMVGDAFRQYVAAQNTFWSEFIRQANIAFE
ncbi:tripartite tricarboxylate transporter substrate binding protein [Roseomonas sp. HJA6]|uniref:Tripartite tricarboxylate transporter substrate binding protein n=1 Tax=Roseomonas alba TaxID=2846776 RepID=A0ABS7A2M6_9PROT|nr:tripartite tricarboxylate transporter substrate binding protein [Neoroseomonas alba]MBW6396413.1 tripartite tricarboxylate transporter substrate binding protein [Neoroseomonas alba]